MAKPRADKEGKSQGSPVDGKRKGPAPVIKTATLSAKLGVQGISEGARVVRFYPKGNGEPVKKTFTLKKSAPGRRKLTWEGLLSTVEDLFETRVMPDTQLVDLDGKISGVIRVENTPSFQQEGPSTIYDKLHGELIKRYRIEAVQGLGPIIVTAAEGGPGGES